MIIKYYHPFYFSNVAFTRHDVEYVWFHIPKNASTFGDEIFVNNLKFKLEYDFSIIEQNKKIVCFLRDPVDRWLSGMSQYIYFTHSRDILDNPNFVKVLFDGLCFDRHTAPQSLFLNNVKRQKLIFFDLDDSNFEESLRTFISNNITKKVIPKIPKLNDTTSRPDQIEIRNILKEKLYENQQFQENLQRVLVTDFILYKELGLTVKNKLCYNI